MDKKEALELVESFDDNEIKKIPKDLWKDRDFAIKCVTLNGLLLGELDTKFKKDKEVIVEAIAETSAAWWDVDESVREDLKNDPDISGLLPDHFFNDN